MRTLLYHLWDRVRSTFWVLPAVVVLGCGGLAVLGLWADLRWGDGVIETVPWLESTAEGAGELLGTVAGAAITVVGMAFSATVVSLTLASQQFGPRLLRNFARARSNQVVLGILLGTFVYCLIVLRAVRSEGGGMDAYVPEISVLGGGLLALLSVGVFVQFVHHVATMIQAENVVADVGEEMRSAVMRFFPEEEAEWGGGEEPEGGREVRSESSGYVQAVNVEGLMPVAVEAGGCVMCECRPGHFVAEGQLLARVTGGGEVDGERVRKAFLLGDVRTAEQDIEFTFFQLSEVAMRALSPSLNDPNTAMNCIDRTGNGLRLAAARYEPQRIFRDEDGVVRVRTWKTDFACVLGAALDQVRHHARGKVDVSCRLLEMLGGVAEACRTEEQREAVGVQVELVGEGVLGSELSEYDAGAVRERLETVRGKLDCGMHDEG